MYSIKYTHDWLCFIFFLGDVAGVLCGFHWIIYTLSSQCFVTISVHDRNSMGEIILKYMDKQEHYQTTMNMIKSEPDALWLWDINDSPVNADDFLHTHPQPAPEKGIHIDENPMWSFHFCFQWKKTSVAMMLTLSSPAVPQVVIMTTCGAANDDKVVIITTPGVRHVSLSQTRNGRHIDFC